MTSYEARWKRSAVQDLRKIDRSKVHKIIGRVEALLANPLPHDSRRLKGTKHHYRIRIGEYRVIYEVNHGTRSLIVHYIRHRKDAYRA